MITGNERRFFITNGSHSTMTWLEGEQSNSFNQSAATINVSDKDGDWEEFISGRKSATADVTVHLDNTVGREQQDLLASFDSGDTVFCFIGSATENSPIEGDMFEAVITGIQESNEKDNVSTRQFSLQVTGKPTRFPA